MTLKLKTIGMGLLSLSLYNAYADGSNFVIKQIRVEGLQRIEVGTVYSYLPVKVGDTLTPSKTDEIIHKLFSTGFFQDVRVEEQGSTLIVDVAERPVISKLSITGAHEFDDDKLVKSLKDNGLADGLIFDQSVLDNAILGLKTEYYNRGLYSVVLTPTVTQLERNRVNIEITISEGSTAKIAEIDFTGNQVFKTGKLRDEMYLTTGNWLSWWFKDNQYSSDKLAGDIEKIRAFYLNQGYIDFRLNSIQVQLTPDKKSVYITVNLKEGSQYRYKSVKLAGDYHDIPPKELERLVTVKPGTIINQEVLNKNVEAIKTKIGDYGYAFANVNPIPEVDAENKTVAYTLFVDTGKKIYVRNINISGNDKTRDVVIRRELRQEEAALYNAAAIKRSKERLDVLGYFKSTDVTTTPVPGVNDQVDMNVKVVENNTGSINFGVGFAQGQGIILNGGISQSNLFGSGKAASINASTSALNQSVSLSFTDPYYLANGTSLGYDIYDTNYTPNNVGISPYSTQTLGARVRTSVPVSEFDRINVSLSFENNQISVNSNTAPLRFVQFTNQYGNSVNAIPLTVSWARNTTDNTLWPTTGANYSQSFTITAPAVGAQYYKFLSTDAWYFPISDSFTWKTNGELGFINAYGDNQQVPFYQNFIEGGPGSIRGYYIGSIGPKDTDGSSLGGTRWAMLSNNLLFPLPGIKDTKSVRMSLFYDIGTLYGGTPFNLTAEQMVRASYGVGMLWVSPMGPIQVSYAIPMFNQPLDNIQSFQFTMGQMF
ncbi:MAG: outer membrane protein assembly factor BamA [Neisseriaceae bacterium]|nr:MAG: outer membrane protein assembly factor BamA [Neisseriaceae bacterium]